MRKVVCLILVVTATFVGCRDVREKENREVAEDVIFAARVLSQSSYARFPDGMKLLVDRQLVKPGLQCRCADGVKRDFLWLGTYEDTDAGRLVLFYSPDQMDNAVTLVARLDGTVEFLPKKEAVRQIDLCKDFFARRSNMKDGRGVVVPEF